MEKEREYIVTAFTENQVGVLNRITAIYLRRKINIESLRVSASSVKGVSMFVITAITTQEQIIKVTQHIKKIIEVLDVRHYNSAEIITQEVALYKVAKSILEPETADIIISRRGTRIIEFGHDYIVVEFAGTKDKIEELRQEFSSRNTLLQYSSSGSVIIHREELDIKL